MTSDYRTAVLLACRAVRARRGRTRRRGVSGPLQRADPRRLPPRSSQPLSVGRRSRPGRARSNAGSSRALPDLNGGAWAGGFDDRPAPVHRVRLLPVRSHRRSHLLQPGPVRSPPNRAPFGAARTRPWRASPIPLRSGAVRSRPRRLGRTSRAEWPAVTEACETNVEDMAFDESTGSCASSARATNRP